MTLIRYLTLTLLLLAGCAATQPSRFFLLPDAPAAADRSPCAPVEVELELPDYLDREQMVIRGEGNEVLVQEFERWGEPLRKQFNRSLVLQLSGVPSGKKCPSEPGRVFIRVYRFDTDHEAAVLSAQWTDRGGVVHEFNRKDPLANGKPEERVRAMGELVKGLGEEVAQTMRR